MPDSDALLHYTSITEPQPLYVSLDDNSPAYTMHLIVANTRDTPVYCNKITLYLPSGSHEADLVGAGKISAINGECSASWTFKRVSDTEITITPPNNKTAGFVGIKDQDIKSALYIAALRITLRNLHINTRIGTARIEITENTGETNNEAGFFRKWHYYPVTKFPR
ncbi:hypothetical protein, partial [Streptomyces hainanensis]